MTGTAIQRLTLTVISSQKIALPPLSEQKRIVTKLDSLISRTTRARKELDRLPSLIARYKQHLLGLAFSGDLSAAWRGRTAKNSGWSRKVLGELITDIVAGKNLRCEERPPRSDEKGVVKVSAVTWGSFDPREAKTLPPSTTLAFF
jgi:type I restriction enzyme S subunit